MTNEFPKNPSSPSDDAGFPAREGGFPVREGGFPVREGGFPVRELSAAELVTVAGGRRCGAGSGGKVGEVPVVTG